MFVVHRSASQPAASATSRRYQNRSKDGRVPARAELGNPCEGHSNLPRWGQTDACLNLLHTLARYFIRFQTSARSLGRVRTGITSKSIKSRRYRSTHRTARNLQSASLPADFEIVINQPRFTQTVWHHPAFFAEAPINLGRASFFETFDDHVEHQKKVTRGYKSYIVKTEDEGPFLRCNSFNCSSILRSFRRKR